MDIISLSNPFSAFFNFCAEMIRATEKTESPLLFVRFLHSMEKEVLRITSLSAARVLVRTGASETGSSALFAASERRGEFSARTQARTPAALIDSSAWARTHSHALDVIRSPPNVCLRTRGRVRPPLEYAITSSI